MSRLKEKKVFGETCFANALTDTKNGAFFIQTEKITAREREREGEREMVRKRERERWRNRERLRKRERV